MTENPILQKSISEQISDEMMNIIQNNPEFDQSTIDKLKQLAITKELNKPAKVTKAIQLVVEDLS